MVNICVKSVLYLIIACECIFAGSAFSSNETSLSVIPISNIPQIYLLGTLAKVRLSFALKEGRTTSMSSPRFSILPE